ncbi:MAG: hypothetical protein ACO1QB_12075 [Verrucomicrobiales bacterium]
MNLCKNIHGMGSDESADLRDIIAKHLTPQAVQMAKRGIDTSATEAILKNAQAAFKGTNLPGCWEMVRACSEALAAIREAKREQEPERRAEWAACQAVLRKIKATEKRALSTLKVDPEAANGAIAALEEVKSDNAESAARAFNSYRGAIFRTIEAAAEKAIERIRTAQEKRIFSGTFGPHWAN